MSERLREIWKGNKPTPLYFVGEKAETREQLINDITKKVMGLVRMPQDGKTPTSREIKALIRELLPSEKELQELVRPLIPRVRDGQDGKTPTAEELRSVIEPLIPKVRDGEDGKTPSKVDLEGIIRPLIIERLGNMNFQKAELVQELSDKFTGIIVNEIAKKISEIKRFSGGGGINGPVWKNGSGRSTNKLTVSDTEPRNPQIGDLWVDSS